MLILSHGDCGTIDSMIHSILTQLMEKLDLHLQTPTVLMPNFQVGDNVKTLNKKAGDLVAKHQTVLDAIEEKERSTLQRHTAEVTNWLEKVAKILASSQQIQLAYENRNCMLCTNCSFHCCSNYSIGKRAFKKQVEVDEAMLQIDKFTLYTSDMVPPKVQRMNTVTEPKPESNLKLYIQNALSFIKEDTQGTFIEEDTQGTFIEEDTQGTLGIWGMAGVGKTTLLKLINNSLDQEENKFYCIFVVASKGCTDRKLQERIVDKLKLSKDGHLDENIFNCLKNKNFVLFVDDMWEPLSLKDVGIPYPLGVCNEYKRKVILTTRLENVCSNMDTGTNIINMRCLEWDEAWALFEKHVGKNVIDSANPRIRTLAEEVARECEGHPLTLKTVGRAMSQNKTVDQWESALKKLHKSQMHAISGMQNTMEDSTILRLSVTYDYLETDRVKECFLLCALWPEDSSIQSDRLIRCWMGHGLLDEYDNIWEIYEEGMMVIETLSKACLLEKVDKNYFIPAPRVKMHGLTRDMALWVARDCGDKKKKWLVFTDGDDESEMLLNTPETDKLSIFFGYEIEGLATMIRSWMHVTTLIIRDRRCFELEDLANIQYCSSLKYLDLSGPFDRTGVPAEIGTLDKLEYLDLRGISSGVVPWEMKNLTNLKYLFLDEVYHIPRGVLSNLSNLLVLDTKDNNEEASSVILDELVEGSGGRQLKALGMTLYTPSSIERLARLLPTVTLTSITIREMRGCTTIPLLSYEFLGRPHMRSHLKGLMIVDCYELEEVVMMMQERRRSSCGLMGTQQLQLRYLTLLKEIVWRGVEPVEVFPKLGRIEIVECNRLEHVSWAAHLPCLEILKLNQCDKLSDVVFLREQVEADTNFPSLRSLILVDLPCLISICDQETAFPSLEYLVVDGCQQLKKLPFLSSASSSCGRKLEN